MSQSGWHGSAAVYRAGRSLRISRIRMHHSWGSARFRFYQSIRKSGCSQAYLFLKEAQGSVSGSVCCIVSGIAWKMDTFNWFIAMPRPTVRQCGESLSPRFWPPVYTLKKMAISRITLIGKPTMPQEARYQTWIPSINISSIPPSLDFNLFSPSRVVFKQKSTLTSIHLFYTNQDLIHHHGTY